MGLTPEPAYLAIDLGAESGRVIRGSVGSRGVLLKEVHRFANAPVQRPGRLAWDIDGLVANVVRGIGLAGPVRSLAVDSWAVDYGLLGEDDALLAAPRCYRDPWLDGSLELLVERVPAEVVYRRTGIQMMQINTLCQLAATAVREPGELAGARRLLMIPDLVRHALGCAAETERTNAGTTQMLDLDGAWASDLLEPLEIPVGILPQVRGAFDRLGETSATRRGHVPPGIPIVAGASHDTAAAVVGTPLPPRPGEAVFISSGTWSLVGSECQAPVATHAARQLNLSNEHGVDGTTRLLRNVMGLWLLQRCQVEWAGLGHGDSAGLLAAAESAAGFGPVIDPDDPTFLNPPSMTEALRRLYTRTGQAVPGDAGATTRSILESLALRYRWCIEAIASVTGTTTGVVHIVGGGSQNSLLCQLTADATGLPVVAGPVEATAAGSIIVQAVADGTLASVAEGRELLRTGELHTYEPRPDERWDAAYLRFTEVALAGV